MSNEANQAEAHDETVSTERRGFIKQSLFAALAAGTVGTASPASGQAPEYLEVTIPLRSKRMTKNEHTKDANREETTVELEIIGANDVKTVTTSYMKRVDSDMKYDILVVSNTQYYKSSLKAVADKSLTRTISITGLKGQIEGDVRLDTISTTTFSEGTVYVAPPTITRVLLKNPYDGMSDEQMIDSVFNAKRTR